MDPTLSLQGSWPQSRNADIYPVASIKDFERAINEDDTTVDTCLYCNYAEASNEKLRRCSRCKGADYCTKHCQRKTGVSTNLFASIERTLVVHLYVLGILDFLTKAAYLTPNLRLVTDIGPHKQAATEDQQVASLWRRIFIFYPDETQPSIECARDYHEKAFNGMSIRRWGRYSAFLARSATQLVPGNDGQPHIDQRGSAAPPVPSSVPTALATRSCSPASHRIRRAPQSPQTKRSLALLRTPGPRHPHLRPCVRPLLRGRRVPRPAHRPT